MSAVLYAGRFFDTVSTNHNITNGNLILDSFYLRPLLVTTTGVNDSAVVKLFSSILNASLFEDQILFNTAGSYSFNCPILTMQWNDGLSLPEGDTIILATALVGCSTFDFAFNLYGQNLDL